MKNKNGLPQCHTRLRSTRSVGFGSAGVLWGCLHHSTDDADYLKGGARFSLRVYVVLVRVSVSGFCSNQGYCTFLWHEIRRMATRGADHRDRITEIGRCNSGLLPWCPALHGAFYKPVTSGR